MTSMICAIHQPTLLPYLGFFRKIIQADVYVIYDTAQYRRNNYHNRVKIKTQKGASWLSLPVSVRRGENFLKAKFAKDFAQNHLGIIENAYRTAPYYKEIMPIIRSIYEFKTDSLSEFNANGLNILFKTLGISPKIYYAHKLISSQLHATEALVALCQAVNATTYISGSAGAEYMDMDLFKKAHIAVQWNDFTAKPYPQQWSGEFIAGLSIIDALFNVGVDGTRKLIEHA